MVKLCSCFHLPSQKGSVWAEKNLSEVELRQNPSKKNSTLGRTPPSPSSRPTSLIKVISPTQMYATQTAPVSVRGCISLCICTGVGQCSCTTDIKQLWEKMDRVQDSVAANNASVQGD